MLNMNTMNPYFNFNIVATCADTQAYFPWDKEEQCRFTPDRRQRL